MTYSALELEIEARKIVNDRSDALPSDECETLLRDISTLLSRATETERERCAVLCRERAALWARTIAADSASPKEARREAMFRQNEARYLAGLIEVDPAMVSSSDDFEM